MKSIKGLFTPLPLGLGGLAFLGVGGLLPLFVAGITPLIIVSLIVLGTVLSAVAFVWQDRNSKPYVLEFVPADWVDVGDGFTRRITIPAKQHHHGKDVAVSVYQKADFGYELVMGDNHLDQDGNVTILIMSEPFVGKIVVT